MARQPIEAPRNRACFEVMTIDQPDVLKDQPKRTWSALRDDLRRDAATLPHRGPLIITDERIQRHRGFPAQEGGLTGRFKGASEGYWDARDTIARINAESADKKDDAA